MGGYDPKLPTLLFAMPNLKPDDFHEFDSVVRRYLGGRYNVLVVCAELALLLPPEDPNA